MNEIDVNQKIWEARFDDASFNEDQHIILFAPTKENAIEIIKHTYRTYDRIITGFITTLSEITDMTPRIICRDNYGS